MLRNASCWPHSEFGDVQGALRQLSTSRTALEALVTEMINAGYAHPASLAPAQGLAVSGRRCAPT